MKISNFSRPDRVVIALLVMTADFPIHSFAETALGIGNGEPGLKIVYKSTNQFVIYLDEPWTVGEGLAGGYDKRNIDVLLDKNYELEQQIKNRLWTDIPEQLYCFNDTTVFTCEGGRWSSDFKSWKYWPRETQVFALNGGSMAVSADVYALAGREYALNTNQLFLGKVGTNIFYWEPPEARKVFFRPALKKVATSYLELPSSMIDLLGVTRSEKKDIGFVVFKKSSGFSYSPNTYSFVEMSFKNAKRVGSK